MPLLIQPSFKIITSLTRHHLIASRPTLFLYHTVYPSHPLSLIVIFSFPPSPSPYYQPNIILFHALPSSSWTFPDFHALPSSSKITWKLSEFPRTYYCLWLLDLLEISVGKYFLVLSSLLCRVVHLLLFVSPCIFSIIYINNFGIYKI